MDKFFKILGSVFGCAVACVLLWFGLFVWNFYEGTGATLKNFGFDDLVKFIESGFHIDKNKPITVELGVILLNSDFSFVQYNDYVESKDYVVAVVDFDKINDLKKANKVNQFDGYRVLNSVYNDGYFRINLYEDKITVGDTVKLPFDGGMTFGEWCRSSYNEYGFAFYSGVLLVNASAQDITLN